MAFTPTLEESQLRLRAGTDALITGVVTPSRGTGPLAGVPFTVKDTIAVAGIRATAGSRALEDHVPHWTATAVQRVLDAGAALVGKSSCPEFAYDLHTYNDFTGVTGNPLYPGVTVGGSSGGDAAAIASGIAAFSLSTDLGGSARWPAACVGITTMRPTVGLVPGDGQLPFASTGGPVPRSAVSFRALSQTISPMARTTQELWTILSTIAGPSPLDPRSVPVPLGDPTAVDVSALRIGWCNDDDFYPLRSDVALAIRATRARLEMTTGPIAVVDASWLEPAVRCFGAIRSTEGMADFRALVAGREALLGERMAHILAADAEFQLGPDAGVDAYLAAGDWRERIRSRVLGMLETTPVLLLPISGVPPFAVGTAVLDIDGRSVPADRVLDICRAITLLGLPAVSVPCGRSAEGLPLSIQVVARPFHDHEAIAVAALIERDADGA